jgi:5-methylcytosine-specific restriction endonuclease McrA
VDPDGQLPFLIPLAIFIAKEIVSEGVEQVTGLPMPTAKNGLKYAIKQANKQIAKEGMKQAAKIVKATSKKVTKKTYYSKKKRLEAHKNADSKCEYCSQPTQTKTPFKSDSAEGDHFIPQARGGKTTSEQLVNSCRNCNGPGGKGSKMPGSEWKPSNPNQRIKNKMNKL